MPDPTEVIKSATASGWMPGMIALLMAAFAGGLVFIVRWFIKTLDKRLDEAFQREQRMALRIDGLEKDLREDRKAESERAFKALDENAKALSGLESMLHNNPCMMLGENQDRIIETVADRVSDRVLGHGKASKAAEKVGV
jgi:hypothetical protein